MTNTSFVRIAVDIPPKTRKYLLRRFKPAFVDLYCKTLTHAYRVGPSYEFPTGKLELVIYGHHRAEDHEALLVRCNGQTFRPDGTRYFIALSTAAGEPPARAGEIDSDSITLLDAPISLRGLKFQRYPLWVQKSDTNLSLVAA
jgi:hypothetical protein